MRVATAPPSVACATSTAWTETLQGAAIHQRIARTSHRIGPAQAGPFFDAASMDEPDGPVRANVLH